MSFTDYTTTFNAIYNDAGNDPDFLSFAAWRQRTQQARDIVQATIKANADQVDKLRKYYSDEIVEKKSAEIKAKNDEIVWAAQEHIGKDYQLVKDAKKARFDHAHAAPSDEQLRLLQVFAMRSTLEPSEVAAVVSKLSDNVQALRVLADVCTKHNIDFPVISDAEAQYEKNIEIMDVWCREAKLSIGKQDDTLGYDERLFWHTPDMGWAGIAARELDNPSFLQIDTSAIVQAAKTTADAAAPEG